MENAHRIIDCSIEEKYGIYQFVIFFLQTCQNSIRPLTPSSLLDSICWSISEPSSSASIYTDSFSSEGISEHHTPEFFDATGDGKESESSFANLTRPLNERLLLRFEIDAFVYFITVHVELEQQLHFLILFLLFAVRNLKSCSKTITWPYYFQWIVFSRWVRLRGLFLVTMGSHVCRFWTIFMHFIRYYYDSENSIISSLQ